MCSDTKTEVIKESLKEEALGQDMEGLDSSFE